jgi:hypothetical protein
MCAMAARPNTGPALAPLQVGVCLEGAHVLEHAIRAGILAHPEDFTLQLHHQNALKSLSREAMLNAVAKRASQLIRYAAWTYMHASCLLLPEPPPNTQPLKSKSVLPQGDPCGPLFFALTLQDVFETVQHWHTQVRKIAYLNDTFIQDPSASVADEYRDLHRLSEQIGLVMQPKKSTVYSPTCANAAVLGEEFGLRVNHRGMVAAGCPIGDPDVVAEEAMMSASKVENVVNALTNLELPVQDQLLLMQNSLQAKLAHYSLCGLFHHIQQPLHISEHEISNASLQIIGREESMVDMEQLWLPTEKGGLGIQHFTALDGIVFKAGFLAAAALARQALAKVPESFQPFEGESGKQLEELWQQLNSTCQCKGACMCEQMQVTSLSDVLNAGMLPGLHCDMSVKAAYTVSC